MSTLSVDEQVQALARLDLEGLRNEWRRRRFGPTPKLRSPEFLRHLMAWRIQAAASGGLDAETKSRLRREGTPRAAQNLTPGTRLSREWKGAPHEVTVEADGFSYAGRTYRSLSQVATAIAGSRWNGPRFFGLRDDPA